MPTTTCFVCHVEGVPVTVDDRGIRIGGLCDDCRAVREGADAEERLAQTEDRRERSEGIGELCEAAWGEGYAAGKDKAHFEVRHLDPDDHAKGCGCEPCQTIRAIMQRIERKALW